MKIFTCLLLFLVSSELLAQNLTDTTSYEKDFQENFAQQGRLSWGLKLGYSTSHLYGKEVDYIFASSTTRWNGGFHAGIGVDARISRSFWLKHELLFTQKGASVTLADDINGRYASVLKTYYLEWYPLNATFYYKGFQCYVGPSIGALMAASILRKDSSGKSYKDKSIFGDESNFEHEKKYLQKFDAGVNLGIEYQFSFGLLLGAKYTNGFTDIFQYANSYTLEDIKTEKIKIQNRVVMLSAGYVFNKRK